MDKVVNIIGYPVGKCRNIFRDDLIMEVIEFKSYYPYALPDASTVVFNLETGKATLYIIDDETDEGVEVELHKLILAALTQ